jgi:hypothetical protein
MASSGTSGLVAGASNRLSTSLVGRGAMEWSGWGSLGLPVVAFEPACSTISTSLSGKNTASWSDRKWNKGTGEAHMGHYLHLRDRYNVHALPYDDPLPVAIGQCRISAFIVIIDHLPRYTGPSVLDGEGDAERFRFPKNGCALMLTSLGE